MIKKITKIITRVFTSIAIITLVLILVLNISTLWSVNGIKRGEHVKSGYFSAIIGSGSMEPTISVNDLLLIKGSAAYQPDDIITYISSQGSLITHRIMEISETGYITQGDANNIPDEEIPLQRVLGKVFFILPAAGGIFYTLLSPVGILIIVCAFIIVLLVLTMRRGENEVNTEDETSRDKDKS